MGVAKRRISYQNSTSSTQLSAPITLTNTYKMNDLDPTPIQFGVETKIIKTGEDYKKSIPNAVYEHTDTNMDYNRRTMDQIAVAQESGEMMDDGYKKLIDRLDQDLRDHKIESRERDAALAKHMEDLMNSQQKMLDLKFTNLDTKLSNMDQNIGHIRTEMTTITQRVDSVHSRVDSLKAFKWGTFVAIFIGVVGIVYANWQVISAMIQISK